MNLITKEAVDRFTIMHDQYISDWHEALATGDTTALDRMAKAYYVAFFDNPSAKPLFFNAEESWKGMQDSVNQLLGGHKNFDHRVIRLKDNEQAVVFYDLSITYRDNKVAQFFTIENWQFIDGNWFIQSEIQQRII